MFWLLKRVATSIMLVWVVATVVFLTLHMVPGDPAEVLLSTGGTSPDPQAVAELREKLGLNRPILEQYGAFLRNLLRFDLGVSLVDEYPVADEILLRLPRTLELIVAGTLLAVVLAQWLRWMPAGGYVPLAQDPGRHFLLLLLPAVAVAKGLAATVFRMARASVLDQLTRDHVRTARAKGLTERRVMRRHVVRNAMIPVTTVLGLQMGTLLGGTVLVEFVFNWPGLSTPLLRAVEGRDYPMVVGIVLTVSGLFLLINLVMDLLYAVLDPRITRS